MEYFNIGDRVNHNYLGAGTVKEQFRCQATNYLVGYIVHFDKTPDTKYNCGENPTFVLDDSDLKIIQ